MAEPWQCPQCGTWMAPGVTEHRCEGDGGVLASVPSGPDEPPGFMSINEARNVLRTSNTATQPATIVVNLSGSVMSERDLYTALAVLSDELGRKPETIARNIRKAIRRMDYRNPTNNP